MAIPYRNLKGAPLSTEELDHNFRELHQRLEALETSPSLQRHGGIERIYQEGGEVVFENTLREVLGRLALPQLRLNPRGIWAAGEDYAFYDLCIVAGKTYLCTEAHQSSALFETDGAHWALIFSTD